MHDPVDMTILLLVISQCEIKNSPKPVDWKACPCAARRVVPARIHHRTGLYTITATRVFFQKQNCTLC